MKKIIFLFLIVSSGLFGQCGDTSLYNIANSCYGSDIPLDAYKATSEPGTWSITASPIGSAATISTGNRLNYNTTVFGIYTVRYTLATVNIGCPAYSERSFYSGSDFAKFTVGQGPFCENDENQVIQIDAGSDPGTWSGTGIVNATTGEFSPAAGLAGANLISYITNGPCWAEDTITIVVNKLKGGYVTPNATVCVGSNSGILTLEEYAGTVIRWESSTNGFASVTQIANVTAFQSFLNVATETKYRAIVKSGICPSISSLEATITAVICDSIFKIRGKVFEDKNQNSIQDSGEKGLPNVMVSTNPIYFASVTDSMGNYEVYAFDTGYVNVKVHLPKYSQQTLPGGAADYQIYVSNINDSVSGKDFGVYFIPAFYDVAITLSPSIARPGFSTYAYMTVANNGTAKVKNVQCELAFDSKLSVSSVSQAYTLSGNKILFSVDSLNPGQSKMIIAQFMVQVGAGNIGYKLNYYASGNISESDIDLTNNADTAYRIITGSYDPNLKEAKEGDGGILPTTKEMEYTIHFQNTGNDTAFTVVVADSLNKKTFDVTSVEMLAASHSYSYKIDTAGVIKFTFSDILLVDSATNEAGSHGFIRFKLNLKGGLKLGDEIKNKAEIYFDFNDAIVTNTAINVISDKTGIAALKQLSSPISIYPNPTTGNVTLKLLADESTAAVISIYDVLGQIVWSENVKLAEGQNQIVLSANDLLNGIYLVQVSGATMNSVISMVLEK